MKIKKQKEKNKNKLKENLSIEETKTRKKYKINLFVCLFFAIIIEAYFITSNVIYASTTTQNFDLYVKISYMVFIFTAIVMFEVAYKKEDNNFVINGIEIGLLGLHILLVGKNVTLFKKSEELYILSTSYIWPIYYFLKALIIYTNENKRRLKQISDIAEIVKEEKPTKKLAKKRKK